MPGRMGGVQRTTQNLLVHRIDTKLNLIYLRGGVPGFEDAYVSIKDAVKKVGWRGMKNFQSGKEQKDWLGKQGVLALPLPAGTVERVKAENWPEVVEWPGNGKVGVNK